MGLSESLSNAANYTGNLFKRLGDLILLIIIAIIPIVDFIFLGYWGKVIRDNPTSTTLPKLENYGDMFVNGLKVFVVGLIWGLILLVIGLLISLPFFALFGAALASSIMSGTIPNLTMMWSMMAGFVPFIILFVVVAFFWGLMAYMSIVHMFKTGSFGKAFAFGEIFRAIGKVGWLRYLGYFVVYFFVSIVVAAFATIPFIGWVISFILTPIVAIFFGRTVGLLYDEALGTAPTAAPMVSPPPPTSPTTGPSTVV